MKRVIQALLVCFYSTFIAAQPFLDIAKALVRFDPESGKLIVGSAEQPNFYSTSPWNIQLINWAIASARSLKTGLSTKGSSLVVGENGRHGVFLIDTKRVSCRPVQGVADLVEVFLDGGTENQLKICENTVQGASGLINCMHVANQKGGGFLRLQVKDRAILSADICKWQPGHPSAKTFNPNAWHQTDIRIGEVHEVQLLSDLSVLDPRTLRTGKRKKHDWVGEEGFIVTPYQRGAIESLVAEAKNRDSHIACSKDLANIGSRRAEDFFCFVIAKGHLPVTDFTDEDINSESKVRERGGYLKL